MYSKEYIYDLIDSYTSGNMSANEQVEFKDLLATNEEVKELYELNLLVDNIVLEGSFSDISKLVNSKRRKKRAKTVTLISVGGLLMIAGAIFFLKDSTRNEVAKTISSTLNPTKKELIKTKKLTKKHSSNDKEEIEKLALQKLK